MMLPVPLTSIEPSPSNFHFASPALALCHFDKSLPSNSMIASDGGGPGSMTVGSFSSFLSAAKAIKALARLARQKSAASLAQRVKTGELLIGRASGGYA